jgi:hypothetical protein
MLRLTADVNGHAIGYVYIHNTGESAREPGVWVYDAGLWDPYRPDKSIFGIEGIFHQRDEGWEKLARIVLGEIERHSQLNRGMKEWV